MAFISITNINQNSNSKGSQNAWAYITFTSLKQAGIFLKNNLKIYPLKR